jgi:hypothetical protein
MDAAAQPETVDTHARIERQPVTTVDELLESVASVVTNSEGETFIRGGRAGEVGYIDDTEIIFGDTSSVKIYRTNGSQHVLWGFGLDSYDQTMNLDNWRVVRDSLQPLSESPRATQRLATQKSKGTTYDHVVALSLDSPPVADSASPPTQLERYLEACYQIALQTEDESEYDDAVAVLTKYAEREDTSLQKLARRYLKLLEDFHK